MSGPVITEAEKRIERDNERAKRLLEFVKGELRDMYVGSRFQFTIDMFNYLEPELKELIRKGEISPPK